MILTLLLLLLCLSDSLVPPDWSKVSLGAGEQEIYEWHVPNLFLAQGSDKHPVPCPNSSLGESGRVGWGGYARVLPTGETGWLMACCHTHTPSAASCRPSPSPTCLFLKPNLPLISLGGAQSDNHSLNLRCWMAVSIFLLFFFTLLRATLAGEPAWRVNRSTSLLLHVLTLNYRDTLSRKGDGQRRRRDVGHLRLNAAFKI